MEGNAWMEQGLKQQGKDGWTVGIGISGCDYEGRGAWMMLSIGSIHCTQAHQAHLAALCVWRERTQPPLVTISESLRAAELECALS